MRRILIEIAVVLLLCFAGYIAWDKYSAPRPVGSVSVPATVAPAVKGAPRVKATVKAPVETIQGPAKANLKLPDAVQKDPNEQVIAASQVKADLHPQTISTVVNTETGETQTFVKTDPYPWLAYEPRGSVGLYYGKKYDHVMHQSTTVGRLQADYEIVRVKAFKLGVTGSVDSDSTAFVGVGIKYQW